MLHVSSTCAYAFNPTMWGTSYRFILKLAPSKEAVVSQILFFHIVNLYHRITFPSSSIFVAPRLASPLLSSPFLFWVSTCPATCPFILLPLQLRCGNDDVSHAQRMRRNAYAYNTKTANAYILTQVLTPKTNVPANRHHTSYAPRRKKKTSHIHQPVIEANKNKKPEPNRPSEVNYFRRRVGMRHGQRLTSSDSRLTIYD